MTERPFRAKPLPEQGPDWAEAIPTVLSECQAELEQLQALSPLSLDTIDSLPRGEAEALQESYLEAGRYSEEFLKRRLELAGFIRRLLEMRTAWLRELRFVPTTGLEGAALAERKQQMAWWNAGMTPKRIEEFQTLEYQLRDLKPAYISSLHRSDDCAPDHCSDALSQGIGIRDL